MLKVFVFILVVFQSSLVAFADSSRNKPDRGEFAPYVDCYGALDDYNLIVQNSDNDLQNGTYMGHRTVQFPLGSIPLLKAIRNAGKVDDQMLLVTDNSIDKNSAGNAAVTPENKQLLLDRTINFVQGMPAQLDACKERKGGCDFEPSGQEVISGLQVCAKIPAISRVASDALAKIESKYPSLKLQAPIGSDAPHIGRPAGGSL
jgi:hypothetical protein